MTAWLEKLRNRIRGETGLRLTVLLGLAGMALILLSGLIPKKTETPQQTEQQTGASDTDSYRESLETRLTALLSGMDGVGSVTVMVTVGGSAEQVYAEEVKTAENERGTQRESAYVITRADGNEAALVSETKYPAVTGVAVLCSGGDHAAVQEKVSRAVSTVLGISPARIYVGRSTAP